MISPRRMEARANAIMGACGGMPDRLTLANPTPDVQCAWAAYHVGWSLMYARNKLGFLSTRGGPGVDSLRWKYRAYRRDREFARMCVRHAADALAQAEAMYARLQPKETP